MAIYKPTFCSPLEGSFDLTATGGDLPVYIECQIDTSNTVINGYSIELYNEEGTRIFPTGTIPDVPGATVITSINQWKTQFGDSSSIYYDPSIDISGDGKNGSKLRFPFIVDTIGPIGSYQIGNNQIGYSATTLPDNKTYFWKLTLYQMMADNNNDPQSATPADKFYDMNLTTGTVLGSTNKRIQTVKSDKIGLDYYVQPVYIPSLSAGTGVSYNPTSWTHTSGGQQTQITNVGPRALIKSYDSTHGHIYPVVGKNGIDDAVIKYDSTSIDSSKANGVRIYKMSNNAKDLNAYQKVAAAPQTVIPWSDWKESIENPRDSYGIQEYYINTTDHEANNQNGTQYYYPFDIIKSPQTPFEPVDNNYLVKEPMNTGDIPGFTILVKDYMIARPENGPGLCFINPSAETDKIILKLDKYPLSGSDQHEIVWDIDPIFWNSFDNVRFWGGIFHYVDSTVSDHYFFASIQCLRTNSSTITMGTPLDLGTTQYNNMYIIRYNNDWCDICLMKEGQNSINSYSQSLVIHPDGNPMGSGNLTKTTINPNLSGSAKFINQIIYCSADQKYYALILDNNDYKLGTVDLSNWSGDNVTFTLSPMMSNIGHFNIVRPLLILNTQFDISPTIRMLSIGIYQSKAYLIVYTETVSPILHDSYLILDAAITEYQSIIADQIVIMFI